MSALPSGISAFLESRFVLSLSTLSVAGPYACNVYYVFRANEPALVFLSDKKTRHAQEMTSDPRAAVTIYAEPSDAANVAEIRGVQCTGLIQELDEGADQDRAAYYDAFPYARNVPGATFWKFVPDFIKFTDNAVKFGYKETWRRES